MKKVILFTVLLSVCLGFSINAQINTNRVLAIGKNALYFEDYVLSIQYFNQVIKSKPYLAEPYLYRAIAKFSLDDYKGAERDLTLCLERNPFLVYAYQCRGAARQNLNNYEGAIEDYNKGLEFHPEDKQMLLNKSIAYVQFKEYDSALATLETLLKFQPGYVQAYLTLGSIYSEKDDFVKALSNYDKALEIDKYYAPAYAQRAMLYLQKEDYNQALKDLNQAIHLETKQSGYHINRGLVRYYLNDLRGAMADYDIVINMDSKNLIALFNRGLLRSHVGDVYGALEDFNQVIELEPDNFMAIYNRAILNEETQNYRNAISDLNKVINEYPNFVPAYYFRSEVKRKMNDLKEAEYDYWYAYDLEQNLRKQREQGKIITGKEVLDSNELTETNRSEEKIREKSDKNINKFNRLVVFDKDEELQSKYKNEIRGKVQDRQVKVDLEPLFVITYYESPDVIDISTSHIDKMISEYNNKRILYHQLKIVNHEAPLTDDQAAHHFQSIDHYSLVLDRNPKDVNACFGRAMDFMVLQDLSEAISDYDRVIDMDPNFIPAYFNRAIVRYKQLEINFSKENNTDANSLSLNIETIPQKRTVKPLNNPYIQQSGDENPKQQEGLNNTKRNYELDLVMRDYETVIQLNPDFVFAYFNKGNLYCLQKDFRSAINNYNEAIKRNPDFLEAYFNRGLTYLYLGETNRGIEDLSKSGELGMVDAYSIIKKMTGD
ncbi:MAG: tetratricopeptide repeat protein [Dysgonamonadaceae bacterium]|jgi:tetratricopeptide (TPR) repeat protein|nr:tetratricopeptide repeat protein [Dysgonamonadaceae bacterium]